MAKSIMSVSVFACVCGCVRFVLFHLFRFCVLHSILNTTQQRRREKQKQSTDNSLPVYLFRLNEICPMFSSSFWIVEWNHVHGQQTLSSIYHFYHSFVAACIMHGVSKRLMSQHCNHLVRHRCYGADYTTRGFSQHTNTHTNARITSGHVTGSSKLSINGVFFFISLRI